MGLITILAVAEVPDEIALRSDDQLSDDAAELLGTWPSRVDGGFFPTEVKHASVTRGVTDAAKAAGATVDDEPVPARPILSDDAWTVAKAKRHVLEAVASGKCFVTMSASLSDCLDAGLIAMAPPGEAKLWTMTDLGNEALRRLKTERSEEEVMSTTMTTPLCARCGGAPAVLTPAQGRAALDALIADGWRIDPERGLLPPEKPAMAPERPALDATTVELELLRDAETLIVDCPMRRSDWHAWAVEVMPDLQDMLDGIGLHAYVVVAGAPNGDGFDALRVRCPSGAEHDFPDDDFEAKDHAKVADFFLDLWREANADPRIQALCKLTAELRNDAAKRDARPEEG